MWAVKTLLHLTNTYKHTYKAYSRVSTTNPGSVPMFPTSILLERSFVFGTKVLLWKRRQLFWKRYFITKIFSKHRHNQNLRTDYSSRLLQWVYFVIQSENFASKSITTNKFICFVVTYVDRKGTIHICRIFSKITGCMGHFKNPE